MFLSELLFFGRVWVDHIRPFHQVVKTGPVQLGKQQQIAGGWYANAALVLGQQALIDAGRHIDGNLRQSAGKPDASQVAHTHHP